MKPLIFREAMVEDFDRLWQLVNESTAGQKTRLTKSKLKEDLFGRRELELSAFNDECKSSPSIQLDLNQAQISVPFCQVILALEGHELIGYLMFHQFYSPWKGRKACIDYVYVKQAHRNTGVAAQLIRRLTDFCKRENMDYLVYDVSRTDSKLKSTLARHGSIVYRDDDTDWSVFRIEFDHEETS